ncbi:MULTISPECIES: cardiolipin synthase [Anaerostipes]|uniref:cardiolipin synthase n=1 Tax=Anaerostipes TaxID=207244 RepID=UPI0025844545|nr:cardiolipin synthase [Anaerostipes sp.]MCI5624082.1 cardiolipin synthase [Anaerostipes sp.]MDY2725628.1 cardiolipin synthase [Anaerostipes faecalis]
MKLTKNMAKLISKILKFLLRRLVIVVVLIVLQLIWMTYVFIVLGEYSKVIQVVFQIFSLVVAIYIVNKEENPAYKLAWIIPILLFPVFGGLLYLILGDKQPAKKLRICLEESISETQFLLGQDYGVMEHLEKANYQVATQAKYITHYGGYPIYENSNAKYYPSGEAMFDDLLDALKSAKHYIFMEFFIVSQGYMWDTILEILKERVNQGVEVRFMYDDVGCVDLLPYKYYKELERYGINAVAFNPIKPLVSTAWNNRDHRKVVVIDGHIAFTGGLNLADEYINRIERFGYWKDAGLKVTGDAVWNFTVMFLQVWNAIGKTDEGYGAFVPHKHHMEQFTGKGFIQPYADNPLDRETVGENVYLNIINASNHYVYMYTPYLIVDNEMITALCLAAKRGVDVRIVTPAIPDKKAVFLLTQSYYSQLVDAGIKIYQYSPGFIHAKCFLSDDKVATVGTINMDFRSLYLHFENGVFMYDSEVIEEMKYDMIRTFSESQLISKEMCAGSLPKRLAQSMLRLLAPLV